MTQPAPLPASEALRVAVIGLGYVGLPLAVEFGKVQPTVGFDISEKRVSALAAGHDATEEVDAAGLQAATQLSFTSDLDAIREAVDELSL